MLVHAHAYSQMHVNTLVHKHTNMHIHAHTHAQTHTRETIQRIRSRKLFLGSIIDFCASVPLRVQRPLAKNVSQINAEEREGPRAAGEDITGRWLTNGFNGFNGFSPPRFLNCRSRNPVPKVMSIGVCVCVYYDRGRIDKSHRDALS